MKSPFKKDFPIFQAYPDLVYLDHAATSQKPQMVIDALTGYYTRFNGSPNRGAHFLSVETTALYDAAKEKILSFLNLPKSHYDIVFTKNATEANNLVAHSYGSIAIKKGDAIVVGLDAHHSLIVPLQQLSEKTGAELIYLPVDEQGEYLPYQLPTNTAFIAIPWINNALGTQHPIQGIVEKAKKLQAYILIDGAQAIGHIPVNNHLQDVDFLTFSSHKMFGPQGIGVLVLKKSLANGMTPFLTGGDMIDYVDTHHTTFASSPKRFEAGTQNVADAVGLTAAIDYIEGIGLETIYSYEKDLVAYAYEALSRLSFVKLLGPDKNMTRGAVICFDLEGVHPHDVASLLDQHGIAIRAGHHCAQPLMKHLKKQATCRASFSIYNDASDVDALIHGLKHVRRVFGYDS